MSTELAMERRPKIQSVMLWSIPVVWMAAVYALIFSASALSAQAVVWIFVGTYVYSMTMLIVCGRMLLAFVIFWVTVFLVAAGTLLQEWLGHLLFRLLFG